MANVDCGVSIPEQMNHRLLAKIDRLDPDAPDNRSERVRDLIRLGEVAEDTLEIHGIDLPADERDREALIRQVLIDGIRAREE